jgi:hypothetical protein
VRGRIALLAVALGTPLAVMPAGSAAPAAREAPTRNVTIRLAGSGVGTWSVDSPSDRGSTALRYSWSGTLKFKVPTRVLKNPRSKFNVPSRGTLLANWNGVLEGDKLSGYAAGHYRCEYHAKAARAPVAAKLTNGIKRGTFNLFLTPRDQEEFFAGRSDNATANCTSTYGENGPPHFGPNWLFRDTTSFRIGNRYYQTSNTAVISLPAKIVPRGSTKLAFPREVGGRNSPFLGKITWKNIGKLAVRAR